MSKTAADEVSEEEEFNNTTRDKETSNECSENREHTHRSIDTQGTGVPIKSVPY